MIVIKFLTTNVLDQGLLKSKLRKFLEVETKDVVDIAVIDRSLGEGEWR